MLARLKLWFRQTTCPHAGRRTTIQRLDAHIVLSRTVCMDCGKAVLPHDVSDVNDRAVQMLYLPDGYP